MTTRRYLRSLERRALNPTQWEQLSDEAVLRPISISILGDKGKKEEFGAGGGLTG